MKTESVGICGCCAISQVDTNGFLMSISIMHTPLYKKNLIISQLQSSFSILVISGDMIFLFNMKGV